MNVVISIQGKTVGEDFDWFANPYISPIIYDKEAKANGIDHVYPS